MAVDHTVTSLAAPGAPQPGRHGFNPRRHNRKLMEIVRPLAPWIDRVGHDREDCRWEKIDPLGSRAHHFRGCQVLWLRACGDHRNGKEAVTPPDPVEPRSTLQDSSIEKVRRISCAKW